MSKKAKELAREMRNAASKLDECSNMVNVNRVLTSSVSLLGSVLSISSVALAPFTGGVSLSGVAVAGSLCTVAGTINNLAGSVIGTIYSKGVLMEMENKLKEFRKDYSISAAVPSEEQIDSKLKTACLKVTNLEDFKKLFGSEDAFHTAKNVKDIGKFTKGKDAGKAVEGVGKLTKGKDAYRTARNVRGIGKLTKAKDAGKAVEGVGKLPKGALFGSVLNAGVSMYDIIDASLELSKKTGCPAGQLLRMIADLLDNLD